MAQTFGSRLRQLREQRGLTRSELARAVGLSFAACYQWEENNREPRREALALLAEALGVSVPFLLTGKEGELGKTAVRSKKRAIEILKQAQSDTPNHRNVEGHIRSILRVVPGPTALERLSSDQIEEYRQARLDAGIGPQALKHGLNVFRGALSLAKAQGYLVPDLAFPPVKLGPGRLRYITSDEEAGLLAELAPARQLNGLSRRKPRTPEMIAALQDLHDLIVILLDTGARCGEIRCLEWSQIDLAKKSIRLWRPKVRNESIIFMTERVFQVLSRRHKNASAKYVFTNKEGGPRNHPRNSWRKAFDRAGLQDCTIHTLRHTHATRLIQNGLSVYEVQKVLGHSDPKTTMRYAHLEQTKVTAKARDVIDRLNQAASGQASANKPR